MLPNASVSRSAEVKDMTSQVQRELDQTRQELRRGVLDLPQETSETTDAMRRVVSDQIRALKELAALVSDSGATFDVVEPSLPVAATTAIAGARFEKPLLRAVERTLEVEAASQSEVLARVAETVAAPTTENPTLGRIGASELSPPRAQPQPWPASSAASQRPVAPVGSGGSCRSWAARMAFESACSGLPRRRARGDRVQRSGNA